MRSTRIMIHPFLLFLISWTHQPVTITANSIHIHDNILRTNTNINTKTHGNDENDTNNNRKEEVSMGTTILAVKYRDGVVVGADSRTSVSGYVSNRYATKISFVTDHHDDDYDDDDYDNNETGGNEIISDVQLNSSLLSPEQKQRIQQQIIQNNSRSTSSSTSASASSTTCCICRSGSAADTQYLADAIRHQILRRQILQHTSSPHISSIATLLSNYLHGNELQASLICAGFDGNRVADEGTDDGIGGDGGGGGGGGRIYSIDLGGTMMEQPLYACNGSGSGYIMGYIDEHFDELLKHKHAKGDDDDDDDASITMIMTEEEAVEFVGKAIELAMDRDGSSGGIVRIYVINEKGRREIVRVPVPKLKKSRSEGGPDEGSVVDQDIPNFAPAVR